jgi:hypothetical protein
MREMWIFMQPSASAKARVARGTVMSAMTDPTPGLCPGAEHRRPGAMVLGRILNPAQSSVRTPMM